MTYANRVAGRRLKASLRGWTILAAGLAGMSGQAMEIDGGNPDLTIRWDNTPRYTLGERVQRPSYKLLSDANANDGDSNFEHGIVTNRLDWLSEADVVYQGRFGARVSGDFWYDQAYASLKTANIVTPGELSGTTLVSNLSNYAERYFRGVSGELLDAFVFARGSAGPVDFNIKVGRHTEIWGESLYLSGAVNGISYAQSPIDVAKAYANPGAEAKELFRPLNNVSLDLQPSENLSISAQYFLQWQPYRFPEDGTYYGMYDVAQYGGTIAYASAATNANPLLNPYVTRGTDVVPSYSGSWGVSARWSPNFLDGTLGLYYRQFNDMTPQLGIVTSAAGTNTLLTGKPGAGYPNLGTYFLSYAGDIRMVGASLAKQIAGISFGAEFNYRDNMPLVSDPGIIILTGPFAAFVPKVAGTSSYMPTNGDAVGAVGKTAHGVLNALYSLAGTALFDGASLGGELAWSHLVGVTKDEANYLGRSYLLGPSDSFRATNNAMTAAISFTPTWYSVAPSIDLSMPTSFSLGLFGNSPVALGGNKNVGTFGVGLSALIQQNYTVSLQYTGEMGELRIGPKGVVQNGLGSLLQDRGALYLIAKTTF